MPKSIAELRKQAKPAVRKWASYELCLDVDLMSQAQSLVQEQMDLRASMPGDRESGPPQRVNDPKVTKLRKNEAALAKLNKQIDDVSGTLVLRAKLTDAEWDAWVDKHPARDEGDGGYDRDLRGADGLVNVDALIGELGKFADTWNDAPIEGAEDWDFIAERAGKGDKLAMARIVVSLYEQAIDLPKWRAGLLGFLKSETD